MTWVEVASSNGAVQAALIVNELKRGETHGQVAYRRTPAWLAWLAFLVAFINLAFVPAMFFGYDAAQFYSAVGWGTTATAPVLVVWWIIIASIILLRTPVKSEA